MNTLGLAVDAILRRIGMRKLLLLALLLVPTALLSQTASTQYQHIKSTWTQPNSTYPSCSATVTSSCLTGYSLILTPPTGTGTANAIPPCTPTVASNCIGNVLTYTWGPGGYLYAGTWNVSLAAVYLDPTGTLVSSSAVTTTTVVPSPFVPSPAGGVSATPVP
jgi:hypothetical protein